MKILFLSRVDLYKAKGGDTFQMEHTKAAIEKIDPSIKIDISTDLNINNIDEYDIVHLFNIDWVCETHYYAKQAKDNRKKLVLSAIHHSETEVIQYENNSRYDFRRIVNPIIRSQALRDELKNIYRCFSYPKKIIPTLNQVFTGIRTQQKEVIKMTDMVLVQTLAEAHDIKRDFKVWDFNYKIVFNGVDIDQFVNANPNDFVEDFYKKNHLDPSINKMILNVGRIEARKNQIRLIEAFLELKKNESFKDYILVFIGAENNHHPEYLSKFKSMTGKNNVYYLGVKPQNFVASAMKSGEIYVQPSYFETTGLVTLEAVSAGMKVVASGERIKEYLEDNAVYCDVDNVKSIKDAIIKSRDLKISSKLVNNIKLKYNWENAASQTIGVYNLLLSKRS